MAFITVRNAKISGIAAAVPKRIERNMDYPYLSKDLLQKYIKTVGVEEKRCAVHDGSLCTSDLCFASADKLLNELNWNRNEIGLLVFVSHTQDYKLPSTACILQNRLCLSTETMAFDIPLGCSGFVYGLGVVGNLISSGHIKKALLLTGNTQSVYASPLDKSTALLFGDAGSAIAMEFDENASDICCHYQTDGAGFENLIVPDGGCRNPFCEQSTVYEEFEDGIKRTRLHEKMNGGAVFQFAYFNVPMSLKALMKENSLELENIDYLLLHQANKYMCENIAKKMRFSSEKTPYNIDRFGNTSGTSIPLLMVTELHDVLQSKKLNFLATGFGVGLSLGSVYFETNCIRVPELIELEQ